MSIVLGYDGAELPPEDRAGRLARPRRYRAGMIVCGWRLLAELPTPKTAKSTARYWQCLCLGCNVVRRVHVASRAYYLRRGRDASAGCRRCTNRRRLRVRLCECCGTKIPSEFKRRSRECMACERAALRNGRCQEGHALRRLSPCKCGEKAARGGAA